MQINLKILQLALFVLLVSFELFMYCFKWVFDFLKISILFAYRLDKRVEIVSRVLQVLWALLYMGRPNLVLDIFMKLT